MKNQQVDLLDPQFARALLERVQGLLIAVVADPHLGLQKDLRPVHVRAMHRLADLTLVAVGGSGVDVAVAAVEGGTDGVASRCRWRLKDAEAEGGYLDPVVECDGVHLVTFPLVGVRERRPDHDKGRIDPDSAGGSPSVVYVTLRAGLEPALESTLSQSSPDCPRCAAWWHPVPAKWDTRGQRGRDGCSPARITEAGALILSAYPLIVSAYLGAMMHLGREWWHDVERTLPDNERSHMTGIALVDGFANRTNP